MRYTTGDIWELAARNDGWTVIPTNTSFKNNGEAVMGAGMAKDAAIRYPGLPRLLANHMNSFGKETIFIHDRIICLPTKRSWRRFAKMDLIENGCTQLVWLGNVLDCIKHDGPIYIPKLGCGMGGLNWEMEVRPVMDSILQGHRFVLVQKHE